MKLKEEKIGEIFILVEVMFYGLFPIIINYSTKLIPPIFFGAISMLVAGIALLVYMTAKNQLPSLLNKKALKYILATAIFIAVFPTLFIYIGTSKTSGLNTAILFQTEILFTFLIVGLFTKEKITPQKILAAIIIVLGAIAILYNGSFEINTGELLIIAGTFFYPIGNIFAKKALKLTTPTAILLIRSFFAGFVLLGISLMFESFTLPSFEYISNNIPLLLLNGVLIYCVSKLLWYEGLKRLDISNAITLGLTHPAFSLVFAYIFLKEVPSMYQWLGFGLILVGIYVITRNGDKRVQESLGVE